MGHYKRIAEEEMENKITLYKKEKCTWVIGKYWYSTSCGKKYQHPISKFKYCPYCGLEMNENEN